MYIEGALAGNRGPPRRWSADAREARGRPLGGDPEKNHVGRDLSGNGASASGAGVPILSMSSRRRRRPRRPGRRGRRAQPGPPWRPNTTSYKHFRIECCNHSSFHPFNSLFHSSERARFKYGLPCRNCHFTRIFNKPLFLSGPVDSMAIFACAEDVTAIGVA